MRSDSAIRAHRTSLPLKKLRLPTPSRKKFSKRLLSSGVVEGLNNKAKVTMRKSYGFRTYRVLELALYHSLGKLPEPDSTHDFFSRKSTRLNSSHLVISY